MSCCDPCFLGFVTPGFYVVRSFRWFSWGGGLIGSSQSGGDFDEGRLILNESGQNLADNPKHRRCFSLLKSLDFSYGSRLLYSKSQGPLGSQRTHPSAVSLSWAIRPSFSLSSFYASLVTSRTKPLQAKWSKTVQCAVNHTLKVVWTAWNCRQKISMMPLI